MAAPASASLSTGRLCEVHFLGINRHSTALRLCSSPPAMHGLQELLEGLTFASECGSLISPPCWKTGGFCTGKLAEPYTPALQVQISPI